MKYSILFIIWTIYSTSVLSQTSVGSWQDHLSFYNVHSVEQVEERIYAATKIGLFFYDTFENTVQKYTKLNGLSDIEVSAIAAIPNTQKLIVGYENGNIDIVEDKTVTNIPDLYLKDISVEKTINHIYFFNDKAYLSTSIGIIVVDYLKNEISDTYILGENSSYLGINQVCTNNDTIFAATKSGLFAAPLSSNILAYYKTWSLISGDANEYASVVSLNDDVFACKKNGSSGVISKYSAGKWSTGLTQRKFVDLKLFPNQLAVITSNSISFYDNAFNLINKITEYSFDGKDITPSFSSICLDDNDNVWIGDSENGLIQKTGPYDQIIVPDGPSSNRAYRMATSENSLWVVGGVNHYVKPIFVKAELSILRNNEWTNLNSSNNKYLKGTYNLNDIAIDPRNDLHGYVSSQHSGIYEIRNDSIVTHFTDKNNNCPMDSAYVWRIVNGVLMDDDGNLFANNMGDSIPIIVKPDVITDDSKANNYGWYQYNYASYGSDSDPWLWQTIQTQSDHFWSISFRNPEGLFVYDIAGTIDTDADDSYRYAGTANNSNSSTLLNNGQLLIWDEDGNTLDVTPKCLAEDQNGYIWVGTNNGIVVYYRPREIFNIDKPIASRIKIPRNDGSDLADYLLENEEITCIAVDGANRKWIGTTDNGVYLVSSDGTQTIHEFNSKNSPLLSNYILSIAINPKSGEVFFGTDKGIVSYRGTATKGYESYSAVKAFPNPVHPNYDGVITVTGLIENSNVRITDISGKIVYQANSTGGQIVWDGKNVFNEKVSSGVYLVFATDEEGAESMVTKIMIIR